MIEIFYHVNMFDLFQIITVRYPDNKEMYVHSTIENTPSYLAEYVIKDDKQYKIYLSGLPEHNLLPIKKQILEEIATYHSLSYKGVEVEII